MEKSLERKCDGARFDRPAANIAKRRSRNRHAKPYCLYVLNFRRWSLRIDSGKRTRKIAASAIFQARER